MAAFHIRQTSTGGGAPHEVLPTGWEEARGSPMVVRVAVAREAGIEAAFHDKAQEVVGNTVPEVVGVR